MIQYTADHVTVDRLADVLAVAAGEEPRSIDVRAHPTKLANGAVNEPGYRVVVEGVSVRGVIKLERAVALDEKPEPPRPDLLYPDGTQLP